MSREVWKAVETKVREVIVVKVEGGRREGGKGNKTRKKKMEEREEGKEKT